MAPVRRAEFETGRALARTALAALGQPAADLLPDADRVPVWPAGFCGSITHARCARGSLCAAAVAPRARFRSLGLDVECDARLAPPVAGRVLTESEWRQLAGRGLDPGDLAVVVFSAKEAVYKAQFPLTRRFLDFPDVRVDLDLSAGLFTAEVSGAGPNPGSPFAGRFLRGAGFVVAAVAIPARPGDAEPAGPS
jgi:4'-phosphopantetheinyl transferase EntD